MGTINKPNINIPLAASYNERGVQGFTNSITNNIDQKKINCFYETTKNSITGGGTLDLTKRPGVMLDDNGGGIYGISTQTAYTICPMYFGAPQPTMLVFNVNSNIVRASSSAATTTIYSSSSGEAWFPLFVDKTFISGIETIVVQVKRSAVIQPPQEKVFFASSSSGGISAFIQITDTDFTAPATGVSGVGKMEHMDGFAFELFNDNNIRNSDVNSLANWTAANSVAKQILQDYPVGLAKFANQIIAFGQNTAEPFYNAGNASGSPLTPIKQLATRIGLVETSVVSGTNYYATLNNKMYFIGRRESGGVSSVGLFTYNGSTFDKVSPGYIDKILSQNIIKNFQHSYYGIHAFSFHGKNAISIALTAENNGAQSWLMFFPDLNDWFEWKSGTFRPINANGFFLGITPNQHRIYRYDSVDKWVDESLSYAYSIQFTLPNSDPGLKRMGMFGVTGDTSSVGAANTLLVEFSDDDYQTFKTAGTISLSSDNKTLKRGGAYRNRAVRLSNTNAVETRLQSFIALVK